MLKIVRGILILVGILLIFLLLTACSSGSVFTKKAEWEHIPGEYNEMPEKDEFSYDDTREKRDAGYDSRLRQAETNDRYAETRDNYTEPDQENNKNKVINSFDDQSNHNKYYETGYASWYGREFHGRKTASGERFDMNRFTAAHKKLPFGTRLEVTNLENGSTVDVVINDRGPYKDGRILDLSYAAARKLGIIASGEGKVGTRILGKVDGENCADNRDSGGDQVMGVGYRNEEYHPGNREEYTGDRNQSDNGNFTIQAGAFYSRRNAERFRTRLQGLFDNPVSIVNENDMYKVRIGNLRSMGQAAETKRILKNEDISSFIIESRD